MSKKPSEKPSEDFKAHDPDSFEYQTSTGLVSHLWDTVRYTEGVLLTQAEAIMGDDSRCKSYKNLIRREVRRMQQYIQDDIYIAYKQQERRTPDEPFFEKEEPDGEII